MPRASRHYLPGYIWHLTHRCHRRQFLLKFARDRRAWVRWLYVARRRCGLCVLDYTVTSNHVHLLVRDQGSNEIARSMQLMAGRTGQDYNRRKRRQAAFWEDRYHATAVESGEHLARCVAYVDLNMVRAGVVPHPVQWGSGGYHEIQCPPVRYRIIDRAALAEALEVPLDSLSAIHAQWVDAGLRDGGAQRAREWTTSLAVGSREFVERVESALGHRAADRAVQPFGDAFVLRESEARYGNVFEVENIAPSFRTTTL